MNADTRSNHGRAGLAAGAALLAALLAGCSAARLDLTTPEVQAWREAVTKQVNENTERLDALEKGEN